jgi:hypothetical protein
LSKQGRHQSLPERVVERVIDRGDRHSESGRSIAIDIEVRLKAVVLLIAHDVGERR